MNAVDLCGGHSAGLHGRHMQSPFGQKKLCLQHFSLRRRVRRVSVRSSDKESGKDRIDWDSSWSKFKESGMKGVIKSVDFALCKYEPAHMTNRRELFGALKKR